MADNFTTDTLEYETQFGTIKALNCHFKTDKAQAFALSCIKIDDSIYTLLRNSSGLILFKGANANFNWFNEFNTDDNALLCATHDAFNDQIRAVFDVKSEVNLKLTPANLHAVHCEGSWYNYLLKNHPDRVNGLSGVSKLPEAEAHALIKRYFETRQS